MVGGRLVGGSVVGGFNKTCSHDTILMVFQNQKEENDTVVFTPNKHDNDKDD